MFEKKLLLTLPVLFFGTESSANERTQPKYNLQFLEGGQIGSDNEGALHAFLNGDSVSPGEYLVDIFVNEALSGRQKVQFQRNARTGNVEPCMSLVTLERLGVDLNTLDQGMSALLEGAACADVAAVFDNYSAVYDASRQELKISIPQAFMSRRARGYVDPELWDEGVSAGFIEYNASGRRNEYNGYSSYGSNTNFRSGINLGAWRLRNDSSLVTDHKTGTQFESNQNYAQRDITSLKSQLTIGTTYSSSQIFDSVRFKGIHLHSDEAMLPDSEIGYAPVVRGVADSSATVEVRQNGFLIYNTNVPPGPFVIRDFYPSGSNGDLEITVVEADGRKTVFTQAFASLPQMVRNGAYRYNASIGKYDSAREGEDSPSLATFGLTYGVTDNVTLFGGFMGSDGYRAKNLGITRNTSLGAFSTNATQSESKGKAGHNSGHSLQINYAKTLSATDTTFSLAGYRFSTEGYRTLPEHVSDQRSEYPRYASGRARTRLDLVINQTLGNRTYGSLYISGNEQRFWNLPGKSQQYNLGYANTWGVMSYNINLSRTQSPGSYERRDRSQATFSLSMPLGGGARPIRSYSTVTADDDGHYALNSGISGGLGDAWDTHYNAQVSHSSQADDSATLGVRTHTPAVRLNTSYTQSRTSKALTAGANGAIVVHAGGINFSQPVGETFTLAQVEGAGSGIQVGNDSGVTTGLNGYAVVSSVQPYRNNWVSVNTRGLSSDIEIENPIQQTVPRRGSVTFVQFKSMSGRRVQFNFTQADGTKIPFGAVITNAQGHHLAVIDPSSMALVMATEDEGTLHVTWQDKSCSVDYRLPEKTPGRTFERESLTCL